MVVRSRKTKVSDFGGKGFVIFLPGFKPNHAEPFDGYLCGDICPGGNFPMHEIYAHPSMDMALEMSEERANEWLREHPHRVRKGAKAVSVGVCGER